jgi:hypothetical protein
MPLWGQTLHRLDDGVQPNHVEIWIEVVCRSMKGAALNVAYGSIIEYLLEELADSWSLERHCRVFEASRKLKVGHHRAPLFLFLSRVLKIIVFSHREEQRFE